MGRVQLLSEDVIKKIAAGEVVERPASVVKELVENSIDARARKISIELEDGGKKRITVSDDGCGLHAEDCLLALKRHATSKIVCPDDLFAISTLGFRGEALAAISAIADFSLVSRMKGQNEGAKVTMEGDEPLLVPWSGHEGTSITVTNLFCKLPVRAKFLKGTDTEFSHCLELVQALALANPNIAFSLSHNGKSRFTAPALELLADSHWRGEDALKARWGLLLGKEEVKQTLYVNESNEYGRWEALISAPGQDRATNKSIFNFVNGRWVKDKILNFGILRGYHSHILKGRHPQVLSFLESDPSLIDVNVHPAKMDLRFQYPAEVQGLIGFAIRRKLREASWATEIAAVRDLSTPLRSARDDGDAKLTRDDRDKYSVRSDGATHSFAGYNNTLQYERADENIRNQRSEEKLPLHRSELLEDQSDSDLQSTQDAESSFQKQNKSDSQHDQNKRPNETFPNKESFPNKQADEDLGATHIETSLVRFSRSSTAPSIPLPSPLTQLIDEDKKQASEIQWRALKYLGTFAKCYLLFEDEHRAKLLLIDQHAFHERILYERLCNEEGLLAESQSLMIPETVVLAAQHSSALREKAKLIRSAGFIVDFIDERMIAIKAVPTLLMNRACGEVLVQIIESISEGELSSPQHIHHQVLATLACHAAVRAGEELNYEDLKVLLRDAEQVDFFHNCPHGRRVLKWIEKNQVASWFDR